MKILSLIATLILTTASCGWLQPDTNSNDRNVMNPTLSVYPPDQYSLSDPSCQQSSDEVTISKTGIQRWGELGVTSTLADLVDTKTEAQGTLVSDAFTQSVYDRHYARVCDPTLYDKYGCVDPNTQKLTGWTLVSGGGGGLRVCKDAFQYDRQSYEGVALTSLNYVNDARSQFEKAGGASLPRLILETLPVVMDKVADYIKPGTNEKVDAVFYHTHNASYAKSSTGEEFIFVFPETPDLGFTPKGFLWESPFVLAHEFGHQVEAHLWGETLGKLGMTRDPFLHKYVPSLIGPDATALLSGPAGPNGSAQVFGAFSEGFADLAGMYALGGNLESLKSVECLGYNRNPLNKTFKDTNVPKILTANVVQTLLTGEERPDDQPVGIKAHSNVTEIANCEVAHFTDIHIVGAILSYYINDVLTTTVNWSKGITSNDPAVLPDPELVRQRYRLLISAVSNLGNLISSHPVSIPDEQFEYFARVVEGSVQNYLKTVPDRTGVTKAQLLSGLCIFSRNTLPALSYVPFSGGTGECANISP